MKIFNFWQNFDSTSNFQKSFKWTREHYRMPFWELQFTHKSIMRMLKKWPKSEISLRTAVMKIFNFWQDFDSTSNFQKSFKWSREHSRMPFWDLQFTHQLKIRVIQKFVKIWNFSKDCGSWKLFNLSQNFWLNPQTSRNPSNDQENTPELPFWDL